MTVPAPVRRAVAALAAGAVLLLAGLASAPAASAHDRLVSSDPADGASLASAPAAVTLTFNQQPLELGLQVVVTGPDGAVVSTGAPAVSGSAVVQPLAAERPAGAYTVDWRVTSGDGHPVDGSFGFTATAAVGATPTASPTASPTGSPTATAVAAAPASADGGTSAGTPAGTSAGTSAGISAGTWAWTVAAGLAGAGLGVVLVRARRRSRRP